MPECQLCKMRKFSRSVAQQCTRSYFCCPVRLNVVTMVNFLLCIFFNHNKNNTQKPDTPCLKRGLQGLWGEWGRRRDGAGGPE